MSAIEMQAPLVRTVATFGVVLVLAVVVWQLTRATYKGDVERICDAEKYAGVAATKDNPAVIKWTKEHLETPEGSQYYTTLQNKGSEARADSLEIEAKHLGIKSCPMIATYRALFAEGQYRIDLQLLCTMTGLPGLDRMNDDERLAKIQKWGETAKSPRTKDVIAKLAAAPAKDRGDTLRAITNDAAVYACELARVLEEKPNETPPEAGFIRVVGAETTGDLSQQDLFVAISKDIDPYRKCYDAALAKDKALAGKLTFRLLVEAGGKVASARPVMGPPNDKEVGECIARALSAQKLPETKAKVTTVQLTLELVPMNKPVAQQAASPDAGTK